MSDLLRQLLIEEEGWRNKVYADSLGVLSIGVGRNLIDKGLSDQEVSLLLANDMQEVESQAAFLAGWQSLNPVQKAALCSMVFQLGIAGIKGFKQMLAALAVGDSQGASVHALDSLWAKQTPERAKRQMQMLATGEWVKK